MERCRKGLILPVPTSHNRRIGTLLRRELEQPHALVYRGLRRSARKNVLENPGGIGEADALDPDVSCAVVRFEGGGEGGTGDGALGKGGLVCMGEFKEGGKIGLRKGKIGLR